MSVEDDDNGGWGRGADVTIPKNILRVYRPDGKAEQTFVENVAGSSHEGRLFLHDKCTGQRASYTVEHVNALLTGSENLEGIKERIVELIPRLSAQQKQLLADGISAKALETVQSIDPDMAASLELRKTLPAIGGHITDPVAVTGALPTRR